MQRYEVVWNGETGDFLDHDEIASDNGEWVKADEALAEIAERSKKISILVEALIAIRRIESDENEFSIASKTKLRKIASDALDRSEP